jgi:hypothetical protein
VERLSDQRGPRPWPRWPGFPGPVPGPSFTGGLPGGWGSSPLPTPLLPWPCRSPGDPGGGGIPGSRGGRGGRGRPSSPSQRPPSGGGIGGRRWHSQGQPPSRGPSRRRSRFFTPLPSSPPSGGGLGRSSTPGGGGLGRPSTPGGGGLGLPSPSGGGSGGLGFPSTFPGRGPRGGWSSSSSSHWGLAGRAGGFPPGSSSRLGFRGRGFGGRGQSQSPHRSQSCGPRSSAFVGGRFLPPSSFPCSRGDLPFPSFFPSWSCAAAGRDRRRAARIPVIHVFVMGARPRKSAEGTTGLPAGLLCRFDAAGSHCKP